jgi:mono/diheme cytochrome c family protein
MRRANTILGAASVAVSVLFVTSASAQDVAAGEEVFIRTGCYTCHGYAGQGANTGPKIAPDPLPYEAFESFIRNTAGDMPPFTPAAISDEELRNLHAYLETIPATPDPASVPLLQNLE